MSWIKDNQDKMVTIIKNYLPTVRVTDEYRTNTNATFPTVYVEFLQNPEMAMDLVNDEVNAVQFTAQLNVYSPDREQCKKITYDLLDVVKTNLRMTIMVMPVFYQDGSLTNGVFRARRVMGQGDTFFG